MKKTLLILFLFNVGSVMAENKLDCHPPGQGFLEGKVKEVFHSAEGETELKEWVMHPSNYQMREDMRSIDRRIKFSNQRMDREALLDESKAKFDQMISNTGRPNEFDNFPVSGSHSKLSGDKGFVSIEISKLSKEELDVIPKPILDKLEPKIKVNYFFPYDKFEYALTYDGKELPIDKALLKIQGEMEKFCEVQMIENEEYRSWYKRVQGGRNQLYKGEWGNGGGGKGGGQ